MRKFVGVRIPNLFRASVKMEKSKLIQKRFFSVKEAAFYSSLSTRLIYQKLKEGTIRFYRVGRKIVLDRQDLDRFVMTNMIMSSDELREVLKEKMRRR